jgi:hypothetical protein
VTKGGEVAPARGEICQTGITIEDHHQRPVVKSSSYTLARFLPLDDWSQGKTVDEGVGVTSTPAKPD